MMTTSLPLHLLIPVVRQLGLGVRSDTGGHVEAADGDDIREVVVFGSCSIWNNRKQD